MRRSYDFDTEEEERYISSTHKLNMHPIIEPEKEGPMFSRGQIVSMMLSFVLLVYALLQVDVPLFFMMLSFLIYMLRAPAQKIAGPWLSNAMKGFSLALGMGAVALAFL